MPMDTTALKADLKKAMDNIEGVEIDVNVHADIALLARTAREAIGTIEYLDGLLRAKTNPQV